MSNNVSLPPGQTGNLAVLLDALDGVPITDADGSPREEPIMSTEPTIEHVRALALAVRDGELTPERRECLVSLLYRLGTAVTLASRAEQHYPDSDAAALGYLIAAWEPVATAYAELIATVRCGGEEHAA